jgi:hypothetical protein
MIIAISGKIGSGKSTVGDIFEREGFQLDSFAKSVKDICSILFGYDRHKIEGYTPADRLWRESIDKQHTNLIGKDFTPRDAMVLVGTEFGRNMIHPNIWIETLFNRYHKNTGTVQCQSLLHPVCNNLAITLAKSNESTGGLNSSLFGILITDLRFPNEYEEIKKRGGIVIRINRSDKNSINHISECALDNHNFDYLINNNTTLYDLEIKVLNIINEIKKKNK